MSVYFEYQTRELWNPASAVANLFVAQVRLLEQLLECPAGLEPGNSDEIAVNPVILVPFLKVVHARFSTTHHQALLALSSAPISILYALYSACEPDRTRWPPMLPDLLEIGRALIA